jgi:hypothetical protein
VSRILAAVSSTHPIPITRPNTTQYSRCWTKTGVIQRMHTCTTFERSNKIFTLHPLNHQPSTYSCANIAFTSSLPIPPSTSGISTTYAFIFVTLSSHFLNPTRSRSARSAYNTPTLASFASRLTSSTLQCATQPHAFSCMQSRYTSSLASPKSPA